MIIGNLLLGIETFVEFKRMQWKFQQTVEQIKSVEAEILQVLNKSMHMIRKLSDELYSFEVSTKLSQQIMKKTYFWNVCFNAPPKTKTFLGSSNICLAIWKYVKTKLVHLNLPSLKVFIFTKIF